MKPFGPANSQSTAEFAGRFRQRAGSAGYLSFADFMELALYDPQVGYYSATRRRVGRDEESDFYTASTLDRVFGPLVASAARSLLAPRSVGDLSFIEIGPEPGAGVLAGREHPFASVHTIALGQPLTLDGAAVVFSNELFDAQPFHRLLRQAGRWRELGVRLAGETGSEALEWMVLPEISPELAEMVASGGSEDALAGRSLPMEANEGYVLDVPWRAAKLADRIAAQPWSGLFLAFDYGRTWRELTSEHPQGTGRAYRRHRSSADLLANPGRQDLTCHICWDWIEGALQRHGFTRLERTSQEAFFMHHAQETIAGWLTDPDPFSAERSQLKQLLHPALMGQRFEALWAIRE